MASESPQKKEGQGPTRWGIVSVGKISHDFAMALGTLDPAEHVLVAVAARDLERARDFSSDFGIKKFYGSHDEMASDDEVEIVYIGAINPGHVDICKLMMGHGKHVLCEKPLALKGSEARELRDFARDSPKKVFFMEAMWSRFNPTYVKLEEVLKKGEVVGDLLHVGSTFGMPIADLPRIAEKELGGGALLDIGEYCLHLAMLAFPKQKPDKILAVGKLNDQGVDECGSVVMQYGGGRQTAFFTYTSLGSLPNEAFLSGTKGIVKLKEPFWASEVLENYTTKEEIFRLPTIELTTNFVNSYILRYEADECRRCILQGLTESPRWTWDDACAMHEMIDEIHDQLGVVHAREE